MIYRIRHRTLYDYGDAVGAAHHYATLHPRSTARQTVRSFKLEIDPPPAFHRRRTGYFGNDITYFQIREPHRRLTVEMMTDIDLAEPAKVLDSPPWEEVARQIATARNEPDLSVREFLYPSPLVIDSPEFTQFALRVFTPGRRLHEAANALSTLIFEQFAFEAGITSVFTSAIDALRAQRGVCQDFAHVMIGALRAIGLSARYVSGYLETQPPPGMPRLAGADASHAWVQVWCPVNRWLEYDPTNGLAQPGSHPVLAWGRDFSDVSPLKGVLVGGGAHSVHVGVDVVRMN